MPRNTYLESRILAADPVELIHILDEHTLAQVDRPAKRRRPAISSFIAMPLPRHWQHSASWRFARSQRRRLSQPESCQAVPVHAEAAD